MLRKSGHFLLAAVLLSGCDFLATREFRSKPSEIRSLPGLAQAGDSVSYRATESAAFVSGPSDSSRILSKRRLVFTFKGDSLAGDDTLKILSLSIYNDSGGALVARSLRLVRFAPEGVVVVSPASAGSGGPRFFPLKASASADSDTAAFLTLPALLVQGWQELRSLGVLDVRREQVALDTFNYHGQLEEAWGIKETVLDGENILGEGMFWYGVSGLLRADQVWKDFDLRDESGATPGGTELRRVLERL